MTTRLPTPSPPHPSTKFRIIPAHAIIPEPREKRLTISMRRGSASASSSKNKRRRFLSLSLCPPVLIINLFARRGDNLFGVELAFNRFVPSLRSSFLKCILSETTRRGRSLLTEQIYRGRVLFRWWPRFQGGGEGEEGYLGF